MKSFLELTEESKQGETHHAMTFGRMNPPTTGHLKLIDKVKEVAHKHNAEHSVVVSHSQDAKKNPLSGPQKVKHLNRYSPGTHFKSSSKEHPTILHHAADLHKKGVSHLHVVVGSDRVKEMHHLLHKYNGVEAGHGKYHFKKIQVHSAGHRDPDAEGSEGMSGTKMRQHASTGNHKEFRKGVPSHVSDKHSKELMHDTRKGMGLHEDTTRGHFKAIFVTGGPGSGKDVVIREAIAESRIVELNFIQARDYLGDKQKLSEKTGDFRREAIRNRGPLIINGPADDREKLSYVKEELEELGYETLMVFVNTTNEASKERNTLLSRMMVESVRQDKWLKAQENTKYFNEMFTNFVSFDNTGDIDSKDGDIHEIYQITESFLDRKSVNETVNDWLQRNNKPMGMNFDSLYKEEKNVKSTNRFIQKTKVGRAERSSDIPADNRANDPAGDNIKWDGTKKTGGYTFRTYEESQPKVSWKLSPKESNFSKDKEKVKRNRTVTDPRTGQPAGLGGEWNTRTNGSGLTGGAGLGESIDYSNASPASTAMPSGGTVNPLSSAYDNKDFKKFRKNIKTEAIDDPGARDMGVGGVLGGSTNKEPLVTPADNKVRVDNLLKKKKSKKTENKNVFKK
jgi:predicted kinase